MYGFIVAILFYLLLLLSGSQRNHGTNAAEIFIHHHLRDYLLVSHRLVSLRCVHQRMLISFHSPQVGPQPPQQPSGEPQTRFFVLRPSMRVD